MGKKEEEEEEEDEDKVTEKRKHGFFGILSFGFAGKKEKDLIIENLFFLFYK